MRGDVPAKFLFARLGAVLVAPGVGRFVLRLVRQ